MSNNFGRENPSHPASVHAMQLVHTYADALLPFKNYLPTDAQLLAVIVKVTQAYNASSTNVLTVGTNGSSYDNIAAAGDVDEATTGADIVWAGAEVDLSAGEALPYVKYAQSGDAATQGRSIVTLLYIPKIDRA